jgi:hypothetical protein
LFGGIGYGIENGDFDTVMLEDLTAFARSDSSDDL